MRGSKRRGEEGEGRGGGGGGEEEDGRMQQVGR